MMRNRSSRLASSLLRHTTFATLALGLLASGASAAQSKTATAPAPSPSSSTDSNGLRFCIASQHSRCFIIPAAATAPTAIEVEQTLNGTLVSKRPINEKERTRLVKEAQDLLAWAAKSEIKIVGKKGPLSLPCSIHLTLERMGESPDTLKVCREHLPKDASAKIKSLLTAMSPAPPLKARSLKAKTKSKLEKAPRSTQSDGKN